MTTHIEIANSNGLRGIQTGQILKVVKETKAYYWIRGFEGNEYKVSKKTARIIDIDGAFLPTNRQPLVNL